MRKFNIYRPPCLPIAAGAVVASILLTAVFATVGTLIGMWASLEAALSDRSLLILALAQATLLTIVLTLMSIQIVAERRTSLNDAADEGAQPDDDREFKRDLADFRWPRPDQTKGENKSADTGGERESTSWFERAVRFLRESQDDKAGRESGDE